LLRFSGRCFLLFLHFGKEFALRVEGSTFVSGYLWAFGSYLHLFGAGDMRERERERIELSMETKRPEGNAEEDSTSADE